MTGYRHDILKGAVVCVIGTVWWLSYSALNERNSRPERALFLKSRPVDWLSWVIEPASAVPYVVGTSILLIWPLVLTWRRDAFWQFLAMVLIGTVIGFGIFAVWPLNIRRPEFTGNRFGESMMRVVFAVDQSANCFPSFHAFFAVLGAAIVARHSESWAAITLAIVLAGVVVVSTITTGQHYVIDILGGAALALFSYFVVRFWAASPVSTWP